MPCMQVLTDEGFKFYHELQAEDSERHKLIHKVNFVLYDPKNNSFFNPSDRVQTVVVEPACSSW
jgi:hypothetical protein